MGILSWFILRAYFCSMFLNVSCIEYDPLFNHFVPFMHIFVSFIHVCIRQQEVIHLRGTLTTRNIKSVVKKAWHHAKSKMICSHHMENSSRGQWLICTDCFCNDITVVCICIYLQYQYEDGKQYTAEKLKRLWSSKSQQTNLLSANSQNTYFLFALILTRC